MLLPVGRPWRMSLESPAGNRANYILFKTPKADEIKYLKYLLVPPLDRWNLCPNGSKVNSVFAMCWESTKLTFQRSFGKDHLNLHHWRYSIWSQFFPVGNVLQTWDCQTSRSFILRRTVFGLPFSKNQWYHFPKMVGNCLGIYPIICTAGLQSQVPL